MKLPPLRHRREDVPTLFLDLSKGLLTQAFPLRAPHHGHHALASSITRYAKLSSRRGTARIPMLGVPVIGDPIEPAARSMPAMSTWSLRASPTPRAARCPALPRRIPATERCRQPTRRAPQSASIARAEAPSMVGPLKCGVGASKADLVVWRYRSWVMTDADLEDVCNRGDRNEVTQPPNEAALATPSDERRGTADGRNQPLRRLPRAVGSFVLT